MVSADDLLSWTDSHGHRFTHDLFKFPGKFHPPIVENVIKRFDPRGVIDPMGGVGTVAVEAKAAGVASLTIDVDPVSVFFATVKTTPLSGSTLRSAWSDLQDALARFRRSEKQITDFRFADIATSTLRKRLSRVQAMHLTELEYWFRRYVLVDYASIDHAIWNGGLPQRGAAVRRFFKACLLSSVRRISNADPAPVSGLEITKHMRERLERGYEIDVAGEFERRVLLNIDRMEEYSEYLAAQGTRAVRATIAQGDCRDVATLAKAAELEADLILFSPPYCNAIEYWRRHQLEYFLGQFLASEDIPAHNSRFIGRRKVGGDSRAVPVTLSYKPVDEIIKALHGGERQVKAWQLWNYFNDMKSRLGDFFAALPSGGRAVIVVGDSQSFGFRIPTAAALHAFAIAAGFEHLDTVSYAIKNRSMQYPLRDGTFKIADESLMAFERP